MPSERITAFNQAAIETINRKLETFDLQQKQITTLKSTVGQLQSHIATLQQQRQTLGANNLIFTWTGGSLTVSWAAGFIQDTRGLGTQTVAVPAGSAVLVASTEYWVGWNQPQASMSFQADLTSLTSLPHEIVICRIFTGTAGQSGAAGGGGTEASGVGQLGKEYKNF